MTDFATLCFLSYNRPEFLPRAIETAIDNAGHPCEIIVHDDGSDAGERGEFLRDYLRRALEVGKVSSVILNPPGHNQGQGTALNRMFNMAQGDPIIKLDHDLEFKPDWLKKSVEIVERDYRVGLLALFKYWYEPVDWRQTIIGDAQLREMGETEMPIGYSFHTHICGSGMVIPRRVWNKLGPFNEHSDAFAEDYEMQCWVSDTTGLFCAIPDEDLVVNHGFGVGPSTVVPAEGQVAKIHHGPLVIG